jgi:uncharacterized protein YgiM (DUF1202 family)
MENIPGEQSIFDFVEDPNPTVKKKKRPIYGVVKSKKLNLRSEPDSDADVLMILNENDPVTIIEDDPNSKYYKVFARRITGFCIKEFITIN